MGPDNAIRASNHTAGFTYAVVAGQLPLGVSMDTSGATSGTLQVSTADTIDGSARTWSVTVRATGPGGTADHAITWNVSRFRKGDIFAGIGKGRYQVFDENGNFKYMLQAETEDEWVNSGDGSGSGVTTGCGYNWATKKLYFTSFDADDDPSVIEINPVPVSQVVSTAFPRNRIGTFRDSGLEKTPPQAATGRSVDNSPESVVFGVQMSWGADETWGTDDDFASKGAGSDGVLGTSDDDRALSGELPIVYMYVAHAGGYYVTNDDDGGWWATTKDEKPVIGFYDPDSNPITNNSYPVYLGSDGQPLMSGGQPLRFDPPRGINRQTGVLESSPGVAMADSPVALVQWGRDLQRWAFDRTTLVPSRTAIFEPHASLQGTDWVDLASDQRTVFYSSEWGVIYKYNVGPGPANDAPARQLSDFATPVAGGPLYALRILPPGDGSGGVLVAAPFALLRVNADGRVIKQYDAGVDSFFAANITPDGKSVWSAATENGRLYKWDIASGALLVNGVETQAEAPPWNPTRRDLDGLCIMGEYTAAQEVCGDGQDNDGDGQIDENCTPIEACSPQSPGDDDGDGFVDANDSDCGGSSVCASSGYTSSSVAGFCARHNYEGDTVLLNPPPPQDPYTDTYEVSGVETTGGTNGAAGLPPGVTFSAAGVATGSPLYTSISNDASTPTRSWRITLNVTRRQGSTIISEYDHEFEWTIENRNRPPVATDHTLNARPNVSTSLNVVTTSPADTDPDAEDVSRLAVTAVTQGTNGAVTFSGNVATYTPTPGYKGPDSFTYTVSDARTPALTDVGVVSITMTNSPPVAVNETPTTRPGLPITVNVLANDSDPDGDALTLTVTQSPTNGTIENLGNGSFRYTPSLSPLVFNDDLFYRITDPFGEFANGRVQYTVLNQRPIALDDLRTIRPGEMVTVDVAANDSDPDDPLDLIPAGPDPKVVTHSAPPIGQGTASRSGTTITYVAPPISSGFVGEVSVPYTLNDTFGGVAFAALRVTIVNRAPDAVNDSATTRPGQAVVINVLTNDTDPDNTPDVLPVGPDPMTITANTNPSNGTVSCTTTACTYTPNPTFAGTDTFTYTISDGYGGSDTATVSINSVNTKPDAVDDSASTRPGLAVSIPAIANDTDPETDPLTITANTSPSNGAVTCTAAACTYTPGATFVGTDTFTYTISDGFGGSDTATVRVTVVNNPPDAVNDTATTRPAQAVVISVLTNDTDPDNSPDVAPSGPDAMTITAKTNGSNGTVTCTSTSLTGTCTYTSTAGFAGTDTFTYTISDGYGGTDTATVTVTVRNTPPDAVNDTYSMIAGGTLAPFNVQTNDPADVDGDTVTITSFTQPANGTVVRNTNGTFTFTPNSGFSGDTTFTYTVSDGFGGTDTATVTIRVVNQPPVARDDAASTNGTRPVTVSVLVNDSDPDSHVISVTGATTPANGSVVVNANGTITYTANSGFQGTDSFFYTIRDGFGGESTARVTITVGPPNRFDTCTCASAKASPSQLWPPNHKQVEVVNVTSLVDPDNGDPLSIRILGIYQDEPTNYLGDGDTTIDGFGVGTSTASVRAERTGNPNVPGNGRVYEIVFEATAADGSHCQGSVFTGVPHDQGQGNYVFDDGIRYDSTVAGGPIVRNALKIESDLTDADVTAREFTAKYVAEARIGGGSSVPEMLLGPVSDLDADTDNFNWTSGQDVLFLLVRAGNNVVLNLLTANQFELVSQSIPCPNGDCDDIFIRAQAGGTGKITLSSLNINGMAVPDTIAIPVGGSAKSLHLSGLSMSDGVLIGGLVKIEWTGTKPTGDTVNFKIQVGTACPTEGGTGGGGTGTPPLARTDTYATEEDTPLLVDAASGVLSNDITFAGSLTASLIDPPSNGTVSLAANGSFTYTPAAGFNGQDTFRYRVNDGSLYSEPALVTITVAPVVDLPNAADDAVSTSERTAVTIAVLGNDADWDGGAVTLASRTNPSNGTAVISGSSIVYTPNAGFIGTDTFTYTIDGDEGSDTATVTVTVVNVNEPPVAVNNAYTTQEDTPLSISAPGIRANDSDPDPGDTFTAVLVTGPANGTLTLNANGSFTYTPNANYNGSDAFTYRVRDAGGLDSNVATVAITITAVNDPPVAVNDSHVVAEDGVLQINAPGVKVNDTDPDTAASSLTVSLETGAQRGTVTLAADGSFMYTPFPNISGSDSFVYRVSDGTASAIGTVTIAITESPDPPVAADDTATVSEDSQVTVAVLGNDSDTDGTTPTLQSVTQPANGTAAVIGNQVRYTPRPNFYGTDTFTYTISDGTSSATAKVVVTVTSVNDAPVANPDTYTTERNTVLNIQTPGVVGNDTDADQGQNLSVVMGAQPANGTVVMQSHGAFSYTPTNDFTGTDTFTYKVSDGTAESASTTVTITVTATNRPPVAANDAYSTDRNTALTIAAAGILANDTDPDAGNTLTASLVSTTAANTGTLVLNANGSFTFTPANDFTGTTTFRYRARDNANADSNEAIVTITVNTTNRPPVAVNDSHTTNKNQPLTVSAPGVLSNDSDPDEGNTMTAVLVTGPPASAGTLVLNANGSFTFTPVSTYVGTTTFTYRARDNNNAESSPATVSIEVKDIVSSGQVCYDGGSNYTQYRATLDWNRLENGDIKVRATVSRNYADNTYGVNKIGWGNKKRDFAAVYKSDFGQLAFYDANNARKIEFKIDYLSPKSGTPSSYGSQGVGSGTNADGAMVFGSAGNIVALGTSIDLNFNGFGYVTTSSNHPLKSYSPPTNSSYATNATYPLWIWDMWYEATVSANTFGSAGFGYPRLTNLHASPAKADINNWRLITCQ